MSSIYDYFNTETFFTEEERMARDAVRDFVGAKILPNIEAHFENRTFPHELTPELGALGVFGSNLPEKYGCAAMSNTAYGLIMQELERGDSGLRSFVSVQGALVMYPIFAYGNEDQRQRWLPGLAQGSLVGAFGLTEPDFGSNPAGMKTHAVQNGDSWTLNGAKMWITNGSVADIALVWAKDDEGKIHGFIVDTKSPGFSAPEMKRKMSLRASVTSELVLQDVVVPETDRLPEAKGLKAALGCLTQARYGIAWGAVGAALACFETAVEYSKTRIQFDRPIGGFQLVQAKLAEMHTEIAKAQLLALRLGQLKDRGEVTFGQVSMAKRNNVAMALDVARSAREILGANGISTEYPIMRHMTNLESVKTYEGTHDIHTLILGQEITGIPAFT
ncbi:MAG: acyl-CoA dehydrogenase [Candidatus Eisenbacteria bacterium]|uniref:Acyl-CoA dehydrogenase n=1 Tax=Eiseniibacteriota bacterium TaxID=2212470 RepID=A0A7Y2H1W1_UNCEI|nr:acyl-CoA dehydrogenase [Candidatus Eisenbacteria bacterium]